MPALNKRQRKRIKKLRAISRDPNQELTTKQQNNLQRLQTIRGTGSADPINRPQSVYDADVRGEDAESTKQIRYQNPDVVGPLGSTSTTVDENGNVIVNQNLSSGQQDILNRSEGLTQAGLGAAGNLVSNYNPFSFDASNAGRERIEQDVFQRLNRDVEEERRRTLEAKEQQLRNKGIPYSNDPNSRYQKELGDTQKRFDDITLQNKLAATQLGGSELERSYGLARGAHQQGISDIGSLSSVGSGLLIPNFQPYSAPNYDVNDPSSYIYAGKNLQNIDEDQALAERQLAQQNALAQQQLSLQQQALNKPPAPPPFP